MPHFVQTASSQDYFLALEHRDKHQRHAQVARILREQRFIRCLRKALTAVIGALALTGVVTLLLMA